MNERIHRRNLNDTTAKKFYLRDGNSYLDLTGYTVTMKLTRKGVVKMNRVITVLNQGTDKGGVEWTPLVAEVNEIGRFRLEFLAENGSNSTVFPRGNHQRFFIWVE